MKKLNDNISIICAPFSIGGPNDAAKDGPRALLSNHLDEDLRELGFEVRIIKPPFQGSEGRGKRSDKKNRIKNINAIIKINKWLASRISEEVKKGRIPLTIGGDHSLAIGTITGVSDALKTQSSSLGVLWIDRHFDAHHPRFTPSWRAHGMPVAALSAKEDFDRHPDFLKLLHIGNNKNLPKVKPENIVQLGIGEKSLVKPKTKWFLMEDIDRLGINKTINDALSYLLRRVKYIYIAWDIDAMNITGTGTSGDGQLTLREGLVIAREINKRVRLAGRLAGFEIMEVAPKLERKELKGQTVDWAIQLVTACFGGNLFNNLSRLKRNIRV